MAARSQVSQPIRGSSAILVALSDWGASSRARSTPGSISPRGGQGRVLEQLQDPGHVVAKSPVGLVAELALVERGPARRPARYRHRLGQQRLVPPRPGVFVHPYRQDGLDHAVVEERRVELHTGVGEDAGQQPVPGALGAHREDSWCWPRSVESGRAVPAVCRRASRVASIAVSVAHAGARIGHTPHPKTGRRRGGGGAVSPSAWARHQAASSPGRASAARVGSTGQRFRGGVAPDAAGRSAGGAGAVRAGSRGTV